MILKAIKLERLQLCAALWRSGCAGDENVWSVVITVVCVSNTQRCGGAWSARRPAVSV